MWNQTSIDKLHDPLRRRDHVEYETTLGHKLRRSEELKTEGLLSIDAPFGELKRPPFRFFALPRELRDAVYSWVFGAFEGKQRHNLAAFKDPAITLVSKQARREGQSILFAGCCWLLTVGANYGEPSRKAETGQLGISPRVHRCLRAAGHDAFFRDIVVRVAGLSVVASIRRQHDQHPWVQNRIDCLRPYQDTPLVGVRLFQLISSTPNNSSFTTDHGEVRYM